MTTPTKFFEDEINLCNERITSIEHIMHGEMRIADEDSTALPMRRADWQRYRDALTTVRHYRPAWRCAATAWRFEERNIEGRPATMDTALSSLHQGEISNAALLLSRSPRSNDCS